MNRLALARVILILVTALVVVVYYAPLGHVDYLNNWRDATYGIRFAPFSNTLAAVDNPKMLHDGIRPGDRAGPIAVYSPQWSRVAYPHTGDQRVLVFQTPQGEKRELVSAYQEPGFDLWQRLGGVLAILPGTVFLIVAFMLVYARPSVMTWVFLLYAIGYFGTRPSIAYYNFLPDSSYETLLFFFSTLFGNFAALPLVAFVLRFPNDDLSGWRARLNPYVWAFLVGTYALYVYDWWLVVHGRSDAMLQLPLQTVLPLLSFAFSALIIVKGFKNASPENRQRMVWLVGGTLISFVAYAIYFIPDIPAIGFVSPLSDNVKQIAGFAVVLMPLSIAYAVLRHRVIDVNFVINRAVVYGILSIVLVALVSLLDWVLGKVLGGAHLTTLLEALITIGLGFALNRLHETFEGWVDRFLFWRRHRAERFLRRVAAALPFATSEDAITDGLVHEPVEVLDLSGGALYRRSESSPNFEFAGAHRASPMFAGFDANHNLVRFLQAEEAVVWLDELGMHIDSEIGVFVLAVPVLVRHRVIAFTLYAAHRNGAQIDPDEVRLFEELGVEAARAYDHVEAVRTRERMEELRRRLDRFEREPQPGVGSF